MPARSDGRFRDLNAWIRWDYQDHQHTMDNPGHLGAPGNPEWGRPTCRPSEIRPKSAGLGAAATTRRRRAAVSTITVASLRNERAASGPRSAALQLFPYEPASLLRTWIPSIIQTIARGMAPRIGRPRTKGNGSEALRGCFPDLKSREHEHEYEKQKIRATDEPAGSLLARGEGMDRRRQQGLVPRAADVPVAAHTAEVE